MLPILFSLSAAVYAQDPEAPEAGGIEGGFGEGVTLTTPGDTLSLTIRGRMQVRASLVMPDDFEGATFEDAAVSEIVIRRARVQLQGHAFTEELTYYFQLAFSNQDTESDLRLPLRDATINYAPSKSFEIRVGQGKVPYGRQRVTSSGSQQLVDRSIVTAELNLDRDVGVMLHSKDVGETGGHIGYSVGVFGGDGRNRLGESFGYLGAARVNIRPMGKFDDNVEADVERTEDPKLSIAGSAAWNQNTDRPRSTINEPYELARFDYTHFGADLMFKWQGACIQGEWFLRQAGEDSQTNTGEDGLPITEYSRSASGWFVQAGQMIGPHFELAARYGDLTPMDGTDPELERQREIGGGPNWYFQEHDLKLQADYFYLPTGDELAGGKHQLRTQLQLWF